ncbi:unnamed protein product [Blepharisma stoltei]|uniref:RING-type domain-containing protein n=1 Tax=Blepharisma stoltei TaxID=1481888 RepID=A0AAU9JQB9_9CILI|nr:unnamed protein product [Blepharisma stoltei]
MNQDDTVKELRRRQQQWMRERDIEMERQSLGLEGLSPGDLVNQLTEKITSKLPSSSKQQKIDKSVADELETNTCSICFELMLPKEHAPIILFPCGHTLCKLCIESHFKTARQKNCPLCRCKVDNQAVNVSLQNLVVVFAKQKNLSNQITQESQISSQSDNGDYTEQLQMYNLRCKILYDEKTATEQQIFQQKLLIEDREAEITVLKSEEDDALMRMRKAEEELELIRKHLRRSNDEISKIQHKLNELETTVTLIDDTLKSVERERAKVTTLINIKKNS